MASKLFKEENNSYNGINNSNSRKHLEKVKYLNNNLRAISKEKTT